MKRILLKAFWWLNNHKGETTVMLFFIFAVLSLIGANLSMAELDDIIGM